jgi:hypothetical protein
MRDHCNTEEQWAHAVLDAARLGLPISVDVINRALWVLGDAVGVA